MWVSPSKNARFPASQSLPWGAEGERLVVLPGGGPVGPDSAVGHDAPSESGAIETPRTDPSQLVGLV